jgi:hypothetical protein
MEEEMKSDTMNNKLTLWTLPGLEMAGKIHASVEAVHDDYEGFRIIVKVEKPQLIILKLEFGAVLSYRNTVESYLLELWHQQEQSIYGKVFYLIENSEYVKFVNRTALEIYKDWDIKHYAIFTNTDCVEILATQPPTITWLVGQDD